VKCSLNSIMKGLLMNTAGTADRSFAPTVPLLGAQGWVVAPAVESPRVGIMALVRQWLRRNRTRHEIAELDEHLLRDIGLTRFDATVESRKHFRQP
jgi:uncharacterized protein YjiS (DUF1127 family)